MKVLVTAGPTREPLDPVRYLGNRSSGKMGYAIAAAAVAAGHEVTLVSGPAEAPFPAGARVISVETSDEMHDAVHAEIEGADVFVMCAAVADFKAARVEPHKIKKDGRATILLELTQTRDILRSVRERGVRAITIGFAAETQNVAENARRKLREKGCALIVANDVSQSGIGFGADENAVTLFFASGETREWKRASKAEIGARLVQLFSELKRNIVDALAQDR